jgi:Ca-activated chloride channel family protein
MKRNHLLGSILLACVCLLTAGSSSHLIAQATTEGSLFAVGTNGKVSVPCPLKRTDVKAEISGFVARVTVTQQFENPFPDKIEAVYTFPLPQAAAVDDMTIVIGNRTVKGKIMTRDNAQKTYDAARAKGQVAALLNQERPNIFTQSVANILPSQQISVTISYVETLQYDEGSYEWSFPMVVGPRYIPPSEATPQSSSTDTQPDSQSESSTANERVPDAEKITPPVMPNGRRAGHDVSIEVVLDAGVPIVSFRSETHEIEALQSNPARAVVRLKDQATIPNKDFVLKYGVAGSQIEDALLTHRAGNDGYFTFILQPPQRVTVADITPKELVFVLDTSGSMSGFPIEKAKETMTLALDGVNPQDTFNLILFSGDTKILFSDPKPATPENISKAKKLLAGANGNGGTEMMKAIRAALDPSDAQDHVRITCFMTDGEVGDDMQIIAEVQKHPNARVFAMGFGSAPNRFLLDKITEYGRGEVEYVTENGDAKSAAQRFHERIRNPLLTDLSIEWNGLPVTDVYPKKIPDLFSAKPVVLSGRYAGGGKGVIRLKGRMSGRDFVREIPVDLPDQQTQHDVLATLWARRKVDDLMGQDMDGAQTGKMKDQLKTEITNLGLTYRMMTQFTSFVAVDDQSVADGLEPTRVDVPVEAPAGSAGCLSGVACSVVTVTSEASMNTLSASVGTSISVRAIQDLPLNARSFQNLTLIAPGTVAPSPGDPVSNVRFNVSVNGQRATSNQFMLDGVSSNFAIAQGGNSPGASASGSAPALTAAGATAPIAALSAVQEVTIQTQSNPAEFGRNSGGVISVVTKSGTNAFHGSAFDILNNQGLNANDWFANSRALTKPEQTTHDFGGTIGGPIQRDRFFFFASYEGMRLQQPVTSLSEVPSLTARNNALPNVRPLLNLFPVPNGPERADGFAGFAASFVNQSRHDSGSLRLDRMIDNRLTLRGSFNFTDSNAGERGADRFSLNTLGRIFNRSESVTGVASFTPTPRVAGEIKVNYSHFVSRSSYRLDNFGGAILPPPSLFSQSSLFANNASFRADLNGLNTVLMSGADVASTQRQLNTLGAITFVSGTHTVKFGADYRRMFPVIGLREHELSALFEGVSQASTAETARISSFTRTQPQRPVFNNFSAYAQDEWRSTTRLTLTYGLRWELNPAPRASNRRTELALTSPGDLLPPLTLAAKGSRLWETTFANFAPRVGLAYQLNNEGTFVIRGGFGLLYDAANSPVGDAFADSYPILSGSSSFNQPFSFSQFPAPSGVPIAAPFYTFDPHLKLPYSIQWSASVEREFGSRNTVSAAYVASANRRLLLTSTIVDPNPAFNLVRSTDNGGRSDYRALQLQFNRRFSNNFGATISYTWGKSADNFSEDVGSRALFRASDSKLERGSSDFDARHVLAGFVSYDLPEPFDQGFGKTLFRKWSIDSVFNIRSATPVNVVYAVPTSFGFLYLRPDVIAGAPLYLVDPLAPGGKRINPNAFIVPAELRQGTLGRNSLRGFSLSELNLGLRRRFDFSETVRLILGVEVMNLLNHPNFAAPGGNEASLGTGFAPAAPLQLNPTFGQSTTNAARSSWGFGGSSFGSSYYPGGARTIRLSMKFEF